MSPPLPLCDAHCHLADARFAADLPEVIARARAAGVVAIHAVAAEEADWEALRVLGEKYPDFLAISFGMHPWFVAGAAAGWEKRLRRLLASGPYGVGETGLDGKIPGGVTQAQRDAFRCQLDLAEEFSRPVSVHLRGAWDEAWKILCERDNARSLVLLHSFSGPAAWLPELERHNLFVSFGGAPTRPNARKPLALAAAAPAGRVLLESDAPDQTPWPHCREKTRNEPAFLGEIASALAAARGETPAQTAAETATAYRAFTAGARRAPPA
ncbi:MAG: TatD family hydrolase [Kiritimatiellae bacterium]|nr:TatD family hydrolase [Kiritimatiellia bacterium]